MLTSRELLEKMAIIHTRMYREMQEAITIDTVDSEKLFKRIATKKKYIERMRSNLDVEDAEILSRAEAKEAAANIEANTHLEFWDKLSVMREEHKVKMAAQAAEKVAEAEKVAMIKNMMEARAKVEAEAEIVTLTEDMEVKEVDPASISMEPVDTDKELADHIELRTREKTNDVYQHVVPNKENKRFKGLVKGFLTRSFGLTKVNEVKDVAVRDMDVEPFKGLVTTSTDLATRPTDLVNQALFDVDGTERETRDITDEVNQATKDSVPKLPSGEVDAASVVPASNWFNRAKQWATNRYVVVATAVIFATAGIAGFIASRDNEKKLPTNSDFIEEVVILDEGTSKIRVEPEAIIIKQAKIKPVKLKTAKIKPVKLKTAKIKPAKIKPAKIKPVKLSAVQIEAARVKSELSRMNLGIDTIAEYITSFRSVEEQRLATATANGTAGTLEGLNVTVKAKKDMFNLQDAHTRRLEERNEFQNANGIKLSKKEKFNAVMEIQGVLEQRGLDLKAHQQSVGAWEQYHIDNDMEVVYDTAQADLPKTSKIGALASKLKGVFNRSGSKLSSEAANTRSVNENASSFSMNA